MADSEKVPISKEQMEIVKKIVEAANELMSHLVVDIPEFTVSVLGFSAARIAHTNNMNFEDLVEMLKWAYDLSSKIGISGVSIDNRS